MNYSPEQVEDIKGREKKALEMLKELNLTPAVAMHTVNIGKDCFCMKPVPFLSDTKYADQPSPIEKSTL